MLSVAGFQGQYSVEKWKLQRLAVVGSDTTAVD